MNNRLKWLLLAPFLIIVITILLLSRECEIRSTISAFNSAKPATNQAATPSISPRHPYSQMKKRQATTTVNHSSDFSPVNLLSNPTKLVSAVETQIDEKLGIIQTNHEPSNTSLPNNSGILFIEFHDRTKGSVTLVTNPVELEVAREDIRSGVGKYVPGVDGETMYRLGD